MKPASASSGLRGEPLILLAILLAGWALLRFALWDPASGRDMAGAARVPVQSIAPAPEAPTQASPEERGRDREDAGDAPMLPRPGLSRPDYWRELPTPAELPVQPVLDPGIAARSPLPARGVVGHSMLLAAGLAQMQIPAALLPYYRSAAADRPRPAQPASLYVPSIPEAPAQPAMHRQGWPSAMRRWHADGWLLWRDEDNSPLLSGRPGYGRSQVGAVIRYELAPHSGHRPQAHMRASAALAGARDRMAATGLSARPLPGVPLRVAGELRANDNGRGVELRPAAYAVTELPPVEMPGGLRAEVYAQGGYVGGDAATPFVDGQVRIDRSVKRIGDFELRAGAGAWGGAQEDIARLDIGPSASLGFGLGEANGRLAADYRFRVAGDAEPSSGPALTLSAGF